MHDLPAAPLEGNRATVVPADLIGAFDAFDAGTALADVSGRRLTWCSPAFVARCGLRAGQSLEAAEARLPGLDALWQASARRTWRVPSGALQGHDLQLVAIRPGVVALRLARPPAPIDDPEQAQALQRHLEDRERLLFTSHTLSVSEMASTLAHELNQPIGTVVNVLRGIQARLERATAAPQAHAPRDDAASAALSPQMLDQGVRLALDQAQFAARIIARIRDFTHSRQPKQELLDLARVAREALALIDWEVLRDSIQVSHCLPDRPCNVVGDETMLQQVFVNLLRNGLEAMRKGPAHQRNLSLCLEADGDGRAATLSIRDSGCGLPPGAEQRLFVPFQSTKPNGTGIGLIICRSFVELHQGRLWFTRNEDGQGAQAGSTFHVSLPLATPTA